MADPAGELRAAERRLQEAQLAGDADALDQVDEEDLQVLVDGATGVT